MRFRKKIYIPTVRNQIAEGCVRVLRFLRIDTTIRFFGKRHHVVVGDVWTAIDSFLDITVFGWHRQGVRVNPIRQTKLNLLCGSCL